MNDNEWLSVSEVSEKVKIPPETIRRYLNRHSVHLRVKKLHKRYSIHVESVTVLEQIRDLYNESKTLEEVEEALSARGVPLTITVKNEADEPMTLSVNEELKEIKQALQEQKEFNMQLMEQMKRQQEYIERSIEKRDRQLLEAIRESQQAKIESAAIEDTEKEKGFFAKLFKRK